MLGHVVAFEAERPALFRVAYRVLGSVADAEDAVQDTWLAWDRAVASGVEVGSAAAYLRTAVTRRALNLARAARRRREDQPGPWLPEPVETARTPEEHAELADSLTWAGLLLLNRLPPRERAAYVLREALGDDYAQVAAALETTPAAARQLLSRARRRLAAQAPTLDLRTEQHRDLGVRLLDALHRGAAEEITRLLAPEVELVTDGGGEVSAARRPIVGADRVLRFLLGVLGKAPVVTVEMRVVNELPTLLTRSADGSCAVTQLGIRDGLVTHVWIQRAPSKLIRFRLPEP